MTELEKLKEKNKKLLKIIQKELNENDEFGCEFIIKRILQNEIESLKKQNEILKNALNEHLEYAEECRQDWSNYDGRTHLSIAASINNKAMRPVGEIK